MNQQENRLTKALSGTPRRRRGSTSSQREGSKQPPPPGASNTQLTKPHNNSTPHNHTVRETPLNHSVREAPLNHAVMGPHLNAETGSPLNHAVRDTQTIQQRLKEMEEALEKETKTREDVERRLQTSQTQFDEYFKRWKESSSELNRYLSRGQGFLIVEDNTLMELTNRLRMRVRDLIINRLKRPTSPLDAESLLDKMSSILGITVSSVNILVSNPPQRCMIMQSFIWRILQLKILECFCWAPQMLAIMDRLDPKISPDAVEDPEAKRRFQVWKATTSTLMYDSLGEKYLQSDDVWQLSRDITSLIMPLATSKNAVVLKEVYAIVNDTIKLDMTLQRQASEMMWSAPRSVGAFNETTMKLESGYVQNAQTRRVSLIVAPALYRRGTSNGDDFRQEELLVPMLVTCDPMEYQVRSEQINIFREHRSLKQQFLSFWKGSPS